MAFNPENSRVDDGRMSESEQLYLQQVEIADYGLAIDSDVIEAEWIAAPTKRTQDRFDRSSPFIGELAPMDLDLDDFIRTEEDAGGDFLRILPEEYKPVSKIQLVQAWEQYNLGEMSLEEYTDIGLRYAALHPRVDK